MITIREEDIELVVEHDPDPEVSYLEQEGFEKEKLDYQLGRIGAFSVYAEVTFPIPISHSYRIDHTVRSPGLHSVMLYMDVDPEEDEYVKEVFGEEKDILIDMLTGMDMGVQRNQ